MSDLQKLSLKIDKVKDYKIIYDYIIYHNMTSKRQFLDPIAASCRLVLLQFEPPMTKIRIMDHTIQLVGYWLAERVFYRPWYKDSREDLYALYPTIVRFIELYLNEKKKTNVSVVKYEKEGDEPKSTMGFFDEPEEPVEKKKDKEVSSEMQLAGECYEYLKKMAGYMITGLEKLQVTYGEDNATMVLQFYCNLLRAGIDGTYTSDMLPASLKDNTTNNFLDSTKIKNLWKDTSIIDLGGLLEKCVNAYKRQDKEMIQAYRSAISTILDVRDEEFRKFVISTGTT